MIATALHAAAQSSLLLLLLLLLDTCTSLHEQCQKPKPNPQAQWTKTAQRGHHNLQCGSGRNSATVQSTRQALSGLQRLMPITHRGCCADEHW
jgi:hypothetical protein